jgi:hypothetical protein
VRCALSKSTTIALEKWITAAGLKRTDYLFPGGDPSGRRPMSGRQLSRLLKFWVAEAGLDPTDYSVESLRRTKALHILKGTGDLQTVRALLGHVQIESTAFCWIDRLAVRAAWERANTSNAGRQGRHRRLNGPGGATDRFCSAVVRKWPEAEATRHGGRLLGYTCRANGRLARRPVTPSGHRRCIAAFEKMSRHDATGPLFDPIVGSALF